MRDPLYKFYSLPLFLCILCLSLPSDVGLLQACLPTKLETSCRASRTIASPNTQRYNRKLHSLTQPAYCPCSHIHSNRWHLIWRGASDIVQRSSAQTQCRRDHSRRPNPRSQQKAREDLACHLQGQPCSHLNKWTNAPIQVLHQFCVWCLFIFHRSLPHIKSPCQAQTILPSGAHAGA